jgi:hypothetical protein
MRRILVTAIMLLLSGVGTVTARECKGVDFPEHLQVNGTELTLNGLGIRKATFLKVNVYVGALYVTSATHDPRSLIEPTTPAQLILHFVRNVGVSDLRKAWSEGFERAAKDQLALLSARIAMLNSWMSDVKTGQRLIFIRKPGAGVEVSVNGVVKGAITGDDFSRALLSIWLGPEPPNEELKSGLLGGACE